MLRRLGPALLLVMTLGSPSESASGQESGARSGQDRAGVCRVSGRARLPAGTKLFETADAKRGIGRFTGRELALEVVVPSNRRAEVETGDGRDGVRVRGYVDSAAVELVTTRTLDVVPAQVWVERGQRVQVLESGPDGLRVEATIERPFEARFSTWTACDGVAPGHAGAAVAAEAGTPYVARVQTLVLYGAPSPSAGPVATLKPSPAFVLQAGERFRDFLRVRYRGVVGIDAWARAGDLLPMDPRRPPPTPEEPAPLEAGDAEPPIPSGTRVVTATRAVNFFDAVHGRRVGTFEPATRLTVLRTVGESASVLPVPLELAPIPPGEFWVRSSELER